MGIMNRIDVSSVVDRLLRGAAPERADDLARLWGTGPDRVHLNDEGAFDIGAFFEAIQASEITLREIWLLSFAAWRAIRAYSGVIWLLAKAGRSFVRDEIAVMHGQPEADAAFDAALAKARELAQWQGSATHPPVAARVKSFLGDLAGPVTERFWVSVASFLAAMCRVRGRLPARIAFGSPQELALALADCL
jgi:hypothetical protein